MESKQNRTMEKRGKSNGRREGMERKNKGDGLEFWGGVYDGWKVGGPRGWLGRALWGVGPAMWSKALLGSCWQAKEPAG